MTAGLCDLGGWVPEVCVTRAPREINAQEPGGGGRPHAGLPGRMARAAPRPGLRPRARPGLASDLSPGPRPKLSSSAANSGPAATARRHRPHRYPRPEPPARPRSPTPRAGRRRALPRPRRRPSGTVHRAVRREAVAPGNRRTLGSAAGGGCQERASGPAGGESSSCLRHPGRPCCPLPPGPPRFQTPLMGARSVTATPPPLQT